MTAFLDMPPPPAAIIITDDAGGLVSRYIDAAQRYAAQNRHVEIHGSCRSACLLALSVPDVCVWPDVVVKAHYAYESDTGRIRYDITKEMMDQLPRLIRSTLNGKLEREYTPSATLDYRQLRALGVTACPGVPSSAPVAAKPAPEPKVTRTGGPVAARAFLTVVRTADKAVTLPFRLLAGAANSMTAGQ